VIEDATDTKLPNPCGDETRTSIRSTMPGDTRRTEVNVRHPGPDSGAEESQRQIRGDVHPLGKNRMVQIRAVERTIAPRPLLIVVIPCHDERRINLCRMHRLDSQMDSVLDSNNFCLTPTRLQLHWVLGTTVDAQVGEASNLRRSHNLFVLN